MTDSRKQLVQSQFGEHAEKFVTSKVHAEGHSLQRLIDLTRPQPDWDVLDVATGGGHTALAYSRHGRSVFAGDLTQRMLYSARKFIQEHSANVAYCRLDAEALPFGKAALDCVVCRIAPHHFPDVEAFVQEAWRILKPGGVFAVADNVTPGEPRVAEYVNNYEILRDPSHQWAYSMADWETFLTKTGFAVTHTEEFSKDIEFDEWAVRMGVEGDNLTRLRVMIQNAPDAVKDFVQPQVVGGTLTFKITEGIIVGRKV